jgi:hypothetical protein
LAVLAEYVPNSVAHYKVRLLTECSGGPSLEAWAGAKQSTWLFLSTRKELIWLKGLYAELCGVDSCINLFYDSQSVIYLTKDQIFHERTKYIDIKYLFMM